MSSNAVVIIPVHCAMAMLYCSSSSKLTCNVTATAAPLSLLLSFFLCFVVVAFRDVHNQLRDEVNEFADQNNVLSTEVSRLERQQMR